MSRVDILMYEAKSTGENYFKYDERSYLLMFYFRHLMLSFVNNELMNKCVFRLKLNAIISYAILSSYFKFIIRQY